MNDQIKNKLGIAVIASLVVFALSAAGYVYSYAKYSQLYPQRTFSVTGEGTVTAIPDIAQFSFSVITEGGTDTVALQKENTLNTNSAIDFLKTRDVDQKDIKTEYYSVDPRYEYSNCYEGDGVCAPPRIVGYTITQTVQVKVRDFEKVGELLSAIVDKGANSVSQLSFTIDDRTALENQAREEAIAKAREKAKSVAKAGGFRLGKLLSVQEGSGYNDYYGYGMGGVSLEAVKSVPSPTIEPGSQEVKVTVTLSYEMK